MGLLAAELPYKGDIWAFAPTNPLHTGPGHTASVGERFEVLGPPVKCQDRESTWIEVPVRSLLTGTEFQAYTIADYDTWDKHWRFVSRNGSGPVFCAECDLYLYGKLTDYLCKECRAKA